MIRRVVEPRPTGLPFDAEAAAQAGISAGFLSSLERSQANASVATLHKLAGTYGVTVTELFKAPAHHGRLMKPSERRMVEMTPGVHVEPLSSGARLTRRPPTSVPFVEPRSTIQ